MLLQSEGHVSRDLKLEPPDSSCKPECSIPVKGMPRCLCHCGLALLVLSLIRPAWSEGRVNNLAVLAVLVQSVVHISKEARISQCKHFRSELQD